MTVEYVYSISAARIVRECEIHLETWRRLRSHLRPGETVRERISFCDSAVNEFRKKLRTIAEPESLGGRQEESKTTQASLAAKEFAREEHAKRGQSWGSGHRRGTLDNAAGRELGRSLEVIRGLSSTGEAQRRLKS